MAEAAGLALGVIGVTALFSTCVEAFDIVVSARECSREYEELSALLGLQRLRFEIWGESVGLPSGRHKKQPTIPYNTHLDLPHVQPDIKRALENVRQLLSSVTAIDGRYGVTSAPEEETTTLSGTHIFQKSFDTLKKRIRKSQKEKSISKVTRWALHDATQFKETILRLTAFVDGLYQVTTSLGLLQQRYEDLRIHEEINAITDGADLELLAEATSKHSGSSVHRTVSDAASKRLSFVAASVRDCDTNLDTKSRPHSNASTYSFYTAKTGPSQRALKPVEEEDSEEDDPEGDFAEIPSSAPESTLTSLLSFRSCAECDEASLQCSVTEDAKSCTNCLEDQKECSFDLSGSFITPAAGTTESLRSTPQHERLMAEAVARAGTRLAPRVLSFEAGDAHHGDQMKEINDNNLDYWIGHVASFHSQAYGGGSVAKRMFHELKTIRKAKVPFISAIPVGDDLSRILASIEGPPETPYEGGIFWILVAASQKAPILRFHTKIYHPNIDHSTGVLCADFQQKWNPAKIQPSLKKHFAESTALWSERTSPDMWSLLSLLIAICGLLASPNVNDPLVPDIAQKLVQDPDHFYEIAKKWTAEHAKASDKPDEASLQFPDEPSDLLEMVSTEPMPLEPESDLEYSSLAMQAYLRSKYDEKFDDDWITSSSSSRHSFAPSRMSNSVSTTATGELESRTSDSESQESRTEPIVDSLLLLDAQQSHLRQLTGEHLSKIEQWRMVREVRLALDKHLCRATPGISQEDLTPKFWTTDSRIRILIKASAIRLYDPAAPEALRQYFNILAASFGGFELSKLLSAEHHESLDPIPATDGAEPNRNSVAEFKQTTAVVSLPADSAVSLVLSVPTTTNSDNLIDEHHLPSSSSDTGQTLELTSTASAVGSKLSESRDHPVAASMTARHSLWPYYSSGAIPSPSGSPRFPYGSHGSYSHSPRPSPSYHSRHYYRDALQNPIRPFSPRYASTGDYGTSTNTSRKQSSWSAPSLEAKRRNSYTYRASYGELDEDGTEYLEYLIDGVIYRVPVSRPKKSTYTYREHGTDPYDYSQAQYAYDRDDLEGSPQYTPPRQRRQSSSTLLPTPSRPHTARPTTSSKKPSPTPRATEADARKHRIPPGYSLKNWDPTEEPIMLLASVFDANSLGKWIYDWTVYHHGPATPIADMAGELWLLLIQLAGKVKRAEECMPRIRKEENREMVEDFIDSGERLIDKLKKLLRTCETPMLRAGKKTGQEQLGKNAGTEFVDSLFGRDRQLEDTEKFMSSIRLWNLRFDANCEDILRRPGQSEDSKSTLSELIMTPVVIRKAFGLEDIAEEPVMKLMTDTTKPAIDTRSPSDPKRARVEAQKIESRGFILADKSIDQPQRDLPPRKPTIRAGTKGAVPSASVTSSDSDSIDWPPCSSPKEGKKNKKATVKRFLTEEDNPGRQPPEDGSECAVGTPQEAERNKDQTANVEAPLKDNDPASKFEGDEWNFGFGNFSTKKDGKKTKVKIWDVEETSKEEDSLVKPEQDEDLDSFGWSSFAKKDEKKKKKKPKKVDGEVALQESGPVPSLVNDQAPKHENDAEWDSWSGWGTAMKGRKKKSKKANDNPALQENGLVPILSNDQAPKHDTENEWDSWSGWGTTTKGKKKSKESKVGSTGDSDVTFDL